MNNPPARRFHRFKWAVVGLVLVCLLLPLGLVMSGCGEGDETDTTVAAAADSTITTGAEMTLTTAAATEMSGTQLGEAIGAAWTEAMQKLNTILEGQPEASAVQSQVAELKEEYVQKLVAFGEQRETLDTATKAEVDAAILEAFNRAAGTDWYTTYMSNYEAYAYLSGDVEFTNLVADFHILAQYANFDLLKSQEPEEAARLGI